MRSPASKPILYAHRGAAAERPENTLPSFARAMELGADALEMDVHLTRDRRVVVSHDPSGERMAGVAREIRQSTLDEVKSWDAGCGFRDSRGDRPFVGKGVRMPTLDEVLVEFAGVPINVDIKQPYPTMVDEVIALVRRHRAERHVTLASFHLATLLAVRRRGYAGPTALSRPEVAALLSLPRRLFARLPLTGVAAQLPFRVGPVDFGTRWVIDKCHALGMRVDYWTVNDPLDAERLLAAGADGIMTDDPAAIAPVFGC